jgi:hypothetical protein
MAKHSEHTPAARATGRSPPALRPRLPATPPPAPARACTVLLPDLAHGPQAADRPGAPPGGAEPSLLPLLALWLAREGWSVLVHHPGTAAAQPGAAAVLAHLGIAPARSLDDVADRWARREPAAVPASLLDGAAGGRALAPAAAAPARVLRVVPCRTAEAERDLAAWAAASRVDALGVADGALGDARRCPRVEVWIGGRHRPELGHAAQAEPPARWAPLPREPDGTATAVFVQQVMSGERPMPEPLRQLAGLIGRAAEACAQEPAGRLGEPPRSCL